MLQYRELNDMSTVYIHSWSFSHFSSWSSRFVTLSNKRIWWRWKVWTA